MRIEINLPDDKEFLSTLQKLADAENRSRKNFIETVIKTVVNKADAPIPTFNFKFKKNAS